MELIIKDHKYRVYWMYNDSDIKLLMQARGSSEAECERVDNLPFKKQLEWWNENIHPIDEHDRSICPNRTTCYLIEDDKEIAKASVVRYHKDPEDRNKARKYALAKLLKSLPFVKEERIAFWEAYLQRHTGTPLVVTDAAIIASPMV